MAKVRCTASPVSPFTLDAPSTRWRRSSRPANEASFRCLGARDMMTKTSQPGAEPANVSRWRVEWFDDDGRGEFGDFHRPRRAATGVAVRDAKVWASAPRAVALVGLSFGPRPAVHCWRSAPVGVLR